MDVFDKAFEIFDEIPKRINQAIRTSIEKYKEELIDYQVKVQWLDLGETSDGIKMKGKGGVVYSQFYKKKKQKLGLDTSHVTLKLRGRLHESVYIEIFDDRYIIKSDLDYAKYQKKYGKVFGIQDKFLKQFIDKRIIPEIKKIA